VKSERGTRSKFDENWKKESKSSSVDNAGKYSPGSWRVKHWKGRSGGTYITLYALFRGEEIKQDSASNLYPWTAL